MTDSPAPTDLPVGAVDASGEPIDMEQVLPPEQPPMDDASGNATDDDDQQTPVEETTTDDLGVQGGA